jgi:predicted  nucleic acid-binding Zn-ribbon protein
MPDKAVMVVDNPNVEYVNIFTFKCTHCGHEFACADYERKCANCGTELFERMKKSTFKDTFIKALEVIGIPSDRSNSFFTKGANRISDLRLCTEMRVIIDVNMETKFGGQYKSFSAKDSLKAVVNNHFPSTNGN